MSPCYKRHGNWRGGIFLASNYQNVIYGPRPKPGNKLTIQYSKREF